MKYLLTSFLLLTSLAASKVNWYNSYVEGKKAALQTKKPIVVFMHREGCGGCDYMKAKVFTDNTIINYMNENFISISLNAFDNDAPNRLKIKVTPVFYFLNYDESEAIETLIGGKGVKKFLPLLQEAKAASKH